MSPLEMARNAARAVEACAEAQDRDPVMSHRNRTGDRGHQAAQLAACMALVSIAGDLHRIAGQLCDGGQP